jgi:hypothetical protein
MDRREAILNAFDSAKRAALDYDGIPDAFERALSQAGWVIVPREPSEAMIDRGVTSFGSGMKWGEIVSCIYRAMISKEGA